MLNEPFLQVDTDTRGTEWGTGGMSTKLTAARIATSAGCNTVICKSTSSHDIKRILHGEQIGTVFYHHPRALKQAPSCNTSVTVQIWAVAFEGANQSLQQ